MSRVIISDDDDDDNGAPILNPRKNRGHSIKSCASHDLGSDLDSDDDIYVAQNTSLPREHSKQGANPVQEPEDKNGRTTRKKKATMNDDNDPHSDGASGNGRVSRRQRKASAKQAENNKENMDKEYQKLKALERKIKRMKSKTDRAGSQVLNDDVESEEETISRNVTSLFSSSIKALPITSFSSREDRTPLKQIRSATSRTVPRVSSNAFKALPPAVELDVDSGAGEAHTQIRDNIEQPFMTGKRTRSSSDVSLTIVDAPAIKKSKGLQPEYREGAEVHDKKPKASDYQDVVQALILRAASEYESLVATEDAFPDTATRHKWAKKTWKHACAVADEKYELVDRINALLRKRGPRIRGHAVTVIRQLIVTMFGFKRGADARSKASNCNLVIKLKTNAAFHYKEPDTLTGYMQGKIISEVLHAVWFDDKCAQGVIFNNLFSPIPFETLALIMTIVDFCLDEWSTGIRVKAVFWEKDVIDRHNTFRTDLKNWEQVNPTVVEGIRKKYYMRACRCAGVTEGTALQSNLAGEALERAREELAGRTGETDSEAEVA